MPNPALTAPLKWGGVLLVSFAPMAAYRHLPWAEDCVRYHATALQVLGLFLVPRPGSPFRDELPS